jgi:hypothetical protein
MFFALLTVANMQKTSENGVIEAFSELSRGSNLSKIDLGPMTTTITLAQSDKPKP